MSSGTDSSGAPATAAVNTTAATVPATAAVNTTAASSMAIFPTVADTTVTGGTLHATGQPRSTMVSKLYSGFLYPPPDFSGGYYFGQITGTWLPPTVPPPTSPFRSPTPGSVLSPASLFHGHLNQTCNVKLTRDNYLLWRYTILPIVRGHGLEGFLFGTKPRPSNTAVAITLVLLPRTSHGADPPSLQDFCVADLDSGLFLNGFSCKNPSTVTSKDFFYEGLMKNPTNYNDLGRDLEQVNVDQFPALNTLGMSMNRVAFLPGGENPPHIHPRATELSLVTEGEIFAGWVSTANVFYWKVLTAGELFVVPQGLVHFQLNVGKGHARFYASFNSQNPGVQFVGDTLFNSTTSIPDEVLSKAFRVNATIIDQIKSRFAHSKLP